MQKVFKYGWELKGGYVAIFLASALTLLIGSIKLFLFHVNSVYGIFEPKLFISLCLVIGLVIYFSIQIFGSIEISEANALIRRLGQHIYWSIPINEITTIADAGFWYGGSSPRFGFVIQSNNKLHSIPYRLKNKTEFINLLKSVNPQIVYQQASGGFATDLSRKYFSENKMDRIIVIIFFIFVFIGLYFALASALRDGWLQLPWQN